MLLFLFFSASTAHAACDGPTTTADLTVALARAENAFVVIDEAGFQEALSSAKAILPCLTEPLTPVEANAWHRVQALDGYLVQDESRVVTSFRSALAAQPSYTLPRIIAIPGNPLYTLFERARVAGGGPTQPVESPPETVLNLDGQRATERPTERPYLVQLIAVDGTVLWSGECATDTPLPDWKAEGVALSSNRLSNNKRFATKAGHNNNIGRGMLIASGVGLLTSGSLYSAAYIMNQRYADFDNPDVQTRADLDTLRTRTNTLVWVSVGTLSVSTGLGVGAFLDAPTAQLRFTW